MMCASIHASYYITYCYQ